MESKEENKILGLPSIRSGLNVPKNHYNEFGDFYYRSCEDILEAVKPLLLTYGCQLYITDSIEVYQDRVYVVANISFVDNDGVETKTKGYAREPQNKKGSDESQITGAASSYARKYALNALFLIDDVKDADTTNNSQKDGKKKGSKNKEEFIERELLLKEVDQKWNGRIYNGFVFIDNVKIKPSKEQLEKLRSNAKYQPMGR